MKFKTYSNSLAHALGKVTPIIMSNPILPILKDVVLVLEENRLKLMTSDTRNTIITTLPVTGEVDGEITVEGKLFLNILKTLPEGMLDFEIFKNKAVITTEKGTYEVPVGDPKDFPKIPEISAEKILSIPSVLLKEAIDRVLFSVHHDDMLPMSGVLIRLGENLTFAATDGMRLAEFITPFQTEVEDSIIVQSKSLAAIKPFLIPEHGVSLSYNDRHLSLQIEETTIHSTLKEGAFPAYKSIIPVSSSSVLTINRSKLLAAVKRAMLLSDDQDALVKFSVSEQSSLSANNGGHGKSAHETLDAQYVGEAMKIGFSGKSLVDVLTVMDAENITIDFTEPKKPGLIRSESLPGYTILVMALSL